MPPPDVTWTVASQLYATDNPLVFTAPNLAYLFDSPVQFGPQMLRTFRLPVSGTAGAPDTTIRVALRHDGTEAEADHFAAGVEKIVREARAVYGELPAFEPGSYTFLATYAPGRQRRRHGASQQHRPDRAGGARPGRAAAARHGGARVLPRLERRAHPAAIARAVQLRRRQRVLGAVGRRRLHAVLRRAADGPRRTVDARGRLAIDRRADQRGQRVGRAPRPLRAAR